jgi:hypothetical protein
VNPVSLIEQQIAHFQTAEKKLMDKVDDFFLGNPWAQTTVGESEAALLKTSTNFVFPIVETATSVLVPSNPQVTVDRERLDVEMPGPLLEAAEDYVNYTLRMGRWPEELSFTVQSGVKYGRGVVKTTWDAENDRPVSRFIDPRNHHFDRTAPRWADVRYEFEATLLSRADIEKRIKTGMYSAEVLKDVSGDRYPTWMEPRGQTDHTLQGLRNFQPWYLVYEFYDREQGKVFHIINRKVVMEDDIVYRPYELLTFNFNGRDVGGISEIGLILSNQEEYNWTETFLLNILRFGIPGILYDGRALTDAQIQKIMESPLGAAIGIKLPQNVQSIGDAFIPRPMIQPPPGAEEMLAKKRDAISYVSAMSDAMRAQTVGAKTATELAFLEGNTRNRLRPRQTRVDALTAAVAEKHLFLAAKYMSKPRRFARPGSDLWVTIDPWSIGEVQASFKMVPYSPMETNKAVKAETLRNLQSMLVNNPNVNQRKLTAKMLHLLDEDDLLMSEEEMAAMQAAAQAPGGSVPTPEGPVGPTAEPPVAEAPSALPPRAAAFSDTIGTPPEGA